MIDCDIHNTVPSLQALFSYLPDWWQDYIAESGFIGPDPGSDKRVALQSSSPDSRPTEGAPPGSDLAVLAAQALDARNTQYGILNCAYGIQSVHNDDFAAALAAALNDWQQAEWLQREPRLRASLVVPSQNPLLAAAEIDRLGPQPGFVQVLLPVRSEAPYGRRRYWPIFEAAERHGLAIGIVPGGAPGTPITSVGWPSFYIEDYVDMTQAFQAQVLSLVAEGVFCKFPTLKVVLVESGVTWLPAVMWRFDKNWKGLRREVPWLTEPPSHYIRRHIRLTTQPMDAPGFVKSRPGSAGVPRSRIQPHDLSQTLMDGPAEAHIFDQVVDHLGSDEMLLYGSAYPHADADAPDALPDARSPDLRRKIMVENARALYGLSR
jgi:predicted TIM-barrel fold metal-dependent hydrolase